MDTKKLFINRLVDEHGRSLVRFLTKKLKDQQDATDVAQDAYLKMYTLNEPEKLNNARAFLFQTASNLATDQLRRKTLHTRYIQREVNQQLIDGEGKLESSAPSTEQTVSAEQQLQLIQRAINELPDNCQQAFLLQRNQGMTYSEIAKKMHVSTSSVEKYISMALKHFHRKLS